MGAFEGLLAKLKALFGPSKPPSSPPEVEKPPVLATTVTEAEPTAAELVVAVESTPTFGVAVEETPVFETLEEPPSLEVAAEVGSTSEVTVDEAPTFDAEPAPAMVSAPVAEEPTLVAAPGGLTLRLQSERGNPSTFQVTKSGATLGRSSENSICLPDLSVSRKHARIAYRQSAYWLSDLGSMGGTWVDGTKLNAPRRVAAGQTIDIGLCRLSVVAAPEDEASPAESAAVRSSKSAGRGR